MFPEVNNVMVLAGAGSAIHVSLIPKTRMRASSAGPNNQQQLVKTQKRDEFGMKSLPRPSLCFESMFEHGTIYGYS